MNPGTLQMNAMFFQLLFNWTAAALLAPSTGPMQAAYIFILNIDITFEGNASLQRSYMLLKSVFTGRLEAHTSQKWMYKQHDSCKC